MPENDATCPRRTSRIVAATAAATALAMILALAVWWAFGRWQLGRIVLTNDGAPLTVQVLGEDDDTPMGEPVELIRRATLALPSGDYRLRVAGEGRLSRTFRFAVNRGESSTQALTLDDNRLLDEAGVLPPMGDPPRHDPIPFDRDTVAIELTPGKADFVESSGGKLSRRDAVTGKIIWNALERAGGEPHPWLSWFVGRYQTRIRPVDPAPDVDGDGTRDLVWVTDSNFLAVSGKDGSILWTYQAELDGPGGAYPEGPELPGPIDPAVRRAWMIGETPAVADLDRDGLPDLVATILFAEFPAEVRRRRPDLSNDDLALSQEQRTRRVAVAVSGRSGHRLWSRAIDPGFVESTDGPDVDRRAAVVPGRKSPMLAIRDGPKWIALDPATGRPAVGPIDLGCEPERDLRYADLDGDGDPEILVNVPAGRTGESLTALSIATGRPLWTATISVPLADRFADDEERDFPLLADLDGDGRAEIITPDSGPLDSNNNYRGVRLLDGTTGRPRWTRPMQPSTRADDGLVQIVAAPDLDHDGTRDLITISMFLGRDPSSTKQGGPGEPERVYVDALSGKDGHPFWSWHSDRPAGRSTSLSPPRWWGRGPDGWPLLAVTIEPTSPSLRGRGIPSDTDPPTVHLLEASTGRVIQSMTAFADSRVADLDGDGLLDLWGAFMGEYRMDLRAFRGEAPETWRALGWFRPVRHWISDNSSEWKPGTDLDGDGIADTLTPDLQAPGERPGGATGSRTAIARSGRDGRLLWKADLGLRQGWFDRDRGETYGLWASPMPLGDLDGDGTPDIIIHERTQPPTHALRRPATLPLALLSGRTGRPTWLAGPLPIAFESHGLSVVRWLEARIIEPGSAPDLLVGHDSPFLKASPTPPVANGPARPHLARLSGRTGRVLWDLELSERATPSSNAMIQQPDFEDVDGDGALDALVFVPSAAAGPVDSAAELKAVSLRDGRLLWSHAFDGPPRAWVPSLEIFDTDDPKRPGIAVLGETIMEDGRLSIHALDGRDGKPRWTWNRTVEQGYSEYVMPRRDGDAGRRLCMTFVEKGGRRRLYLVLGPDGREILNRALPAGTTSNYTIQFRLADLDGDGRDELLTSHDERVRARDARAEELWSWPETSRTVVSVLPASADRPAATVLLNSGVALDGKTGRPTWRTTEETGPNAEYTPLDPGDSARRPTFVSYPPGLTICRSVMPTTPAGPLEPPLGDPVPPGRAGADPRWTRPLPWTGPILYVIGPKHILAAIALALINVPIPLAILWLAACRRPWTIRLLMALPFAAGLPLWVFRTIEPLIPAQIGPVPASPWVAFAVATVAGVPIDAVAGLLAWCLFRRRWETLAVTIALTLATTALIAALWIRTDSRAMPTIEHYGRTGWSLAFLPGATAAGAIILIGWFLRGIYRSITRLATPRGRRPIDAVSAEPSLSSE